jgi:hypothetical protein
VSCGESASLAAQFKRVIAGAPVVTLEVAGRYWTERCEEHGIVRDDLLPDEQTMYDAAEERYVGICRNLQPDRVEQIKWEPLRVPAPRLHVRRLPGAPRARESRSCAPRGRKARAAQSCAGSRDGPARPRPRCSRVGRRPVRPGCCRVGRR